MNQLKTFDSSYSIEKSHFEKDGAQSYLVSQPMIRYFKVNMITNTDYVSSWKSKGYLLKVLNHLIRLIIVLLRNQIMMAPKQD